MSADPTTPYDALLLVSFGGPGEARRRGAVPAQRHAGQGHPRRAARGGRRALLRVRRPQPDQRPEPRAGRGDRGRPRGQRRRPARLLGQPQLGPLPARRARADEGRRHHPGRRAADQRLLVLQRLPAVPREPRRRRRRGPRRAPDRPAARTTSTTPASSSRWSTPPWPRSPTCPRTPAAAGTWSSSPTRSRSR